MHLDFETAKNSVKQVRVLAQVRVHVRMCVCSATFALLERSWCSLWKLSSFEIFRGQRAPAPVQWLKIGYRNALRILVFEHSHLLH